MNLMGDYVIVTRHPAAEQFIRQSMEAFRDAPVVATATPELVRGKVVAGNLPLDLAAEAREVYAIIFPPGKAPRGQEYTLEQMIEAGARLERFVVLDAEKAARLESALRADGYPFSLDHALDAVSRERSREADEEYEL